MKRLLVALIMLAAFFCLPVKAEAAGKALRIPGPACQKGNDIYYQGKTDKELPVKQTISYYLDGEKMDPDEIAGKSGKVTIRFDYKNNQK